MAGIRSVLWIGGAEGLARSGLPEAPAFDVVWERDVRHARLLSIEAFDAIVVEADDAEAAQRILAQLGAAARRRPALVRSTRAVGNVTDALGKLFERPATPRTAQADSVPHIPGVVARSEAMQAVLRLALRAAASQATVLVTGETGTGKERVARLIHEHGARSRGPFVALNCAAFPDTLLESELLGHVRGAFSGADRDRRGLFEEANGGSLLLDEVGETSPGFQAKLLRVLQERVVRPVGANRERAVDVRVIAATHRDLRRAVREGRFREDLYYRIAVLRIAVPPLRERVADIAPLVVHLLARHARAEGRPPAAVDGAALRRLETHRWPGNVRELENELQHALAMAEPGAPLRSEHFSPGLGAALEPLASSPIDTLPDEPLRDTLARFEALLIRRALAANGQRRTETARRLGLTREGLYKKMQRLGIG